MAISPPALSIGGVELWRQDQFVAWHRTLCIPGNLYADPIDLSGWGCATPEGGWSSPVADGAWWCASVAPESTQVAGMWVTSVEGLDASTWQREMVDLALCGSSLGRPTVRGRRITITGHVRAKTCRALGFYLQALDYSLRDGFGCGIGCGTSGGPELTWLDDVPETGATEEQVALLVRMIPNVGLLTPGLEVIRRWQACHNGCAGSVAEVRFTLGSPSENIYAPALTFAGGDLLGTVPQGFTGPTCKVFRRVGSAAAAPPFASITEVTGSGVGAPSATITGTTPA